jgi:D-alanyl-lipoteichoic acid acyltransferase DltB (MBOAT superfamily)
LVFSSSVFLFAFLPLTLLVYFLIPAGFVMARNTALLIASLIFYGWGEPKYIIVMLVSIIANYVLALLIDKYNTAGKRSMAKAMLVVDVAVNPTTGQKAFIVAGGGNPATDIHVYNNTTDDTMNVWQTLEADGSFICGDTTFYANSLYRFK